MSDVWDEMDGVADRVEREVRREQQVAEADARQLHLASRALVDVAWEAMQSGHRIRLLWNGGEVADVPIAAVGDLVVMRTDDGAVGIHVPTLSSVEVSGERRDGGSAGDRTVESFKGWCRMIEARAVRVSLLGGSVVEGSLTVVASDHLLLKNRNGHDVAVATSQVAAISVGGDPFLSL